MSWVSPDEIRRKPVDAHLRAAVHRVDSVLPVARGGADVAPKLRKVRRHRH
eukprot:CAMPEP_0181263238 /NCGR_PEP_ID=MMETSP1097-20121128/2475_1 /TAXON_ID=35684 /ORGANISM="Pseudopedinella elastica, Strain CCMP716" /LENGTH=50 /DNA_ID=CAMNT_0023362015 /DNA_START=133 /DNA_END=282 /DNA_ORIENTATION=-